MIQKKCFSKEWIDEISEKLGYKDKLLIEKSIRALSLLEMLVSSGCPFIFKGGTALMLILNPITHRLSIDIDIICPPRTNIEDFLKKSSEYGFSMLKENNEKVLIFLKRIQNSFTNSHTIVEIIPKTIFYWMFYTKTHTTLKQENFRLKHLFYF